MKQLWTIAWLVAAASCGDAGGTNVVGTTTTGDGGTTAAGTTSATVPTTGDASSTGGASGSSGTSGGDSGSGDTSGGDSGSGGTSGSTGDDPFAGASTCSRESSWNMGNKESPFMNPGMACLTCHKDMAPKVAGRILVGGTVYATGHEPDLCFGIDGVADPMFVEITDADRVVTQLPVNEGGNFVWDKFMLGALTFPIHVRVVRGEQERVMLAPQMDGDCNRCHTEGGANAAPGRIVAP